MSTRTCTRLQHGEKFDGGVGVVANGIDIWGNGYLQGKDLLRQPNPFRNQAWRAAVFFNYYYLLIKHCTYL